MAQWQQDGGDGGAGMSLKCERPDGSETPCVSLSPSIPNPDRRVGARQNTRRGGLAECRGAPHVDRAPDEGQAEACRRLSCWAALRPFENMHRPYPYWPEPALGRNKWLRLSPHLRAAFLRSRRLIHLWEQGPFLAVFLYIRFDFIITPTGSLLS